ncbi:MAG: hypothetical protein ACLTC4_05975 [Hungatella hathewayi]|uniref:Uncharacterized protein n=1 Tax=Hungatella hathewayi WAL-18680 TaxID=742737 RepID=G5IHL6_9FIRM|nr:hypothetical protein HMPREF9473_02994 [ [Hungatella hathewayi WAL-18680]
MSKRIKPVQPGQTFGDLETRWYWNTKSGERVWKCVCTCGGYCMVKERGLTEHLVTNCGCKGGYGR